MIISEHLCGIAIAYSGAQVGLKNGMDRQIVPPLLGAGGVTGRPQGSLVGFQKRQVQNAVHYLSSFSHHKSKYGKGPLVFVCTTSPNWGQEIYNPKISKFTHNLRNGYGCSGYVWVREFTGKGYPHYHFCCDMPDIDDPRQLSVYWASLFGADGCNSVRLGSKPDKHGKRVFRVNPKSAGNYAYYLGKYLGKSLAHNDLFDMKGRRFGISPDVAKASKPIQYNVQYHFTEPGPPVMTAAGTIVPGPVHCIGQTYSDDAGRYFDKHQYTWKKAKAEYPVYFGRKIKKYGQKLRQEQR